MTSKDPADHREWTAVDQTADPEAFVRFLSATRASAIAAAERDPQAAFAYLDVREGHRILDAACGQGDVTGLLARLVGPTGQVIGVDLSETMIRAAQARLQGTALPVAFHVGDITALDFPPATFDRVRAARVLEHLPDPRAAVRELMRVTCPGGRVALQEPDYDTFVIAGADRDMSRTFTRFFSDRVIHNGQIGSTLPELLREAGLTDITVDLLPVRSNYTAVREMLASVTERAIAEGAMEETPGRAWLADIDARGAAGTYVAAFLLFRVAGTVPV
ncbi:MAG TPA: methyltransferase domain-containing protein [Ktedonobacterales bacterium]